MGINTFSIGISWLSVWHIISQRCKIERWNKGTPIGNCISGVQWSRDWWCHVTPKGQGCDPKIFEAQYYNNRVRYIVGSYWLPTGNGKLRVQWSDRWHRYPRRSRWWPQYVGSLISQKLCKRKLHTRSPMVTQAMTSCDHKRSKSWPQCLWSSILITQSVWNRQLLVEIDYQ